MIEYFYRKGRKFKVWYNENVQQWLLTFADTNEIDIIIGFDKNKILDYQSFYCMFYAMSDNLLEMIG